MTKTATRSARPVKLIAIGLTALSVVFLAIGVMALSSSAAGEQERLRQARTQAVAAATNFAVAMDNVDGDKFDAYMARINKLLTTKARTTNEEGLKALRSVYQTGKVKGSGKVKLAGVSQVRADAATVLVIHDQRVASTAGTVQHYYRWSVDLRKVNGRWLVDNFTPIQEGGQ